MQKIKNTGYEHCHVKNLKEGQVVYEDLIVENKVLITKGGVLTERTISKLKNHHVQYVCVEKQSEQVTFNFEAKKTSGKVVSLEKKQTIAAEKIEDEFYKLLGFLSLETRYGKVLKNKEDVYYVKKLFLNYMKNPIFYQYLQKIKEFDDYTYYHIVDVFTLCTLFSKKEDIFNVEELAIGFLFHDIGKLDTPIHILRKKGRLSKKEFSIVQEHTERGYEILKQIGLEKVAYLAKSHHERIDGSGYPEGKKGEEQSKELQILQLIDSYSAITLFRPYKEVVAASHAISILYNDLHLYNKELLESFIDFIGIYPENAVVLLSDGSQAIVEKVNSSYPLLPEVKLFQSYKTIMLPIDLSVTIKKILSYHVNTPKDLFSKFSDYLISGNNFQMETYHAKLKNYYKKFEWFTHIYLPVFQVFEILKLQNTFSDIKIQQTGQLLLKIVDEALLEFRLSSDDKDKTLIIVNGKLKSPALYKLFEGLLYSDDINSYIMTKPEKVPGLDKVICSWDIKNLIVLGNPLEINGLNDITSYYLSELQVESFLNRFVCTNLHKVKLKKELAKYKQE